VLTTYAVKTAEAKTPSGVIASTIGSSNRDKADLGHFLSLWHQGNLPDGYFV
jgi:hypothetical protein